VSDSITPESPPAGFDIEQPACFYLGREYDLAQKKVLPDKYVMYDARDLTTHGVIVGMTGSGKTGLAISLLEEAAIDGIPCIILDPKGDLSNLLLQFPDLDPADFEKWLNPEDAKQKKLTSRQLAEQLAARWRQGLAETAQPVDRIKLLKNSSEWRIYTPGSELGLPLSLLGNFAAPRGKLPMEALTQKIDAVATALLGLTGITTEPMQSREHVLIANLLQTAWKDGKDLDLPKLILQIPDPPFRNVGAYSLEAFFPKKDRVKFASTLNNVHASPSFATWQMGEALDLGAMLYRNGKPQQLIFSIAHLDDTQRMFFTALLLEEVLSWTRKQSGTTNLRALLYFDEVFGYLPPHPGNPPSKRPLLTLLKQARAFGVGVLLATQNPVDLDYKALSNAGTWFIGKLQTERDKARLMDGLESVAAEQGTLTDRGYLENVMASLGNRIFLMHNIHKQQPLLFQSRWALSFLRGPMTREQVAELMEPLKQQQAQAVPQAIPLCLNCHEELPAGVSDRCPKCGQYPWVNAAQRDQDRAFRESLQRAKADGTPPAAIPVTPVSAAGRNPSVPVATLASATDVPGGAAPVDSQDGTTNQQPVLGSDVTQFYLARAGWAAALPGSQIEYRPYLLGIVEVVFVIDKRSGREHCQPLRLLVQPAAPGHPMEWDKAESVPGGLDNAPIAEARWGAVSEALDTGRKLRSLEKAFGDYLYSTRKLALFENRTLQMIAEVDETEEAFRQRCRIVAGQQRDQAKKVEQAKFKPKFVALGEDLPADTASAKSGTVWSWLGMGGGSSKPTKEEEKLRKVTTDYYAKMAEIEEKWKLAAEEVTGVQVKPRKSDVRVTHFGVGWVPFCRRPGSARADDLVPACR